MIASIVLAAIVALSALVSPSVAQTSVYSFCFTSSSMANSPYGPWSVATTGQLTVNSTAYFVNDTASSGGGQRMAYDIKSASGTRTQLNRDGSTSTAQLGLCPTGTQGSDNRLFQAAPWTDWNGFCLSVISSTNSPSGTNNWIVYPNNFPTQQVELYYDLPDYNYPTEYHHDNQTNAQMTVVAGSSITCTPAPITASLQTATMSYQFCYQAYAAASGSVPAWQVAITGTMVTQSANTTSKISGQTGRYILSVNGQRYQSVNGGATTSAPIVGQTWHNSGGGDANEVSDDPLLLPYAPHLVTGYGLVLYTATIFNYSNGVQETVDNRYAKVNIDPLAWNSTYSRVMETQGPTPDWSQFAITCGSCPLITNSTNAATDVTLGNGAACPGSSAAPATVQYSAALLSAAMVAALAMLL